jgi:hypothetical protein
MVSHFCQNKKAMPIEAVYTFGVILNIPNPLVDLFEGWDWEGNGDAPARR